MSIELYNTYSRKIEKFSPIKKNQVGLYTCGPTVYNFAHIGNLRSYIFEDILRRVLEFNDYKILHVQNITDVGHLTSDADTGEDKIEKAAQREHKSAWDLASYYTKTFKDDIKKLNILAPSIWVKATDTIKEQIDYIKILEKKGFTYKTKDGVYFDTSKLKDYGHLARIRIKSLKPGIRVKMGDKRLPTDFALWKFSAQKGADPELVEGLPRRQMEWDSSWGVGFPGWHIECSAISLKYLGKKFDIHTGGVDHIGVHHTNEIAQAEGAFGINPARIWMHGEFLEVDSNKMAKSQGNFYTLRDLEKRGFNPLAYRYLNLMAHYRQKLNFSWESLEAAQKGLAQIYGFLYNMFLEVRANGVSLKKDFSDYLKNKRSEFTKAINDDLNSPQALAVMFEVMHDTNEMLYSGQLSKDNVSELEKLFLDFDKIFGLKFERYLEKGKKEGVPTEIKKMVTQRVGLRIAKKFDEADKLRIEIEKSGFQVEDSTNGPIIKKIKIL